ncbi:MAG: sialidase family protein [Phycisphaeraceae bacterium]
MLHLIRHSMTAALAAIVIALAAVAELSGSGDSSPGTSVRAAIIEPAAFGAVDSVDVCVDGRTVHLLLGRNGEGDAAGVFMHTISGDGGKSWRQPVIVNQGGLKPVSHHRGADARLIARGEKLFAVWVTPGTGFGGTGPMGTALSTDGGKTWKPGPNPADHGTTGSHRFMALTDDGFAFHLLWLDDRDNKRGLRHASSTDGGATWSKNHTVDDYTCACCWNTIVHVPSASGHGRGRLFAMYRDIEPSDMGLAVSSDGGETWTKQGHIGNFGWIFKGCPHVGGGIVTVQPDRDANTATAKADPMFAAVWTGLPEAAGCYLYRSDDAGVQWTKVMPFGDKRASHPVIAAQGGRVTVMWDEATDTERAVMAMTSTDAGATWGKPARLSAEGTPATHPVVTADPTAQGFFTLWTQLGEGGKYVLNAKRF